MSGHTKLLSQINNPWIYLISGRRFHFLNPSPREFAIHDIAWGLSRQARFYGHTHGNPYSVAQHSVLVSREVPAEHAFAALMHDGAEALISDINKYLKMALPDYRRIEAKVEQVVLAKYGLPWPMSPEVKHADNVLAVTELRDLQRCTHWKRQPFKPLAKKIVPWTWQRSYREFLKRYHELKHQAKRA